MIKHKIFGLLVVLVLALWPLAVRAQGPTSRHKALQEKKAEIAALKARLKALEDRIGSDTRGKKPGARK